MGLKCEMGNISWKYRCNTITPQVKQHDPNSFSFDCGTDFMQFQNASIEMYSVWKCIDPCTFQWQCSV